MERPFTAVDLRQWQKYALEIPIQTTSLARFFQSVTKEEPWHNDQERRTIKRFQELVTEIKNHLQNLQVYRVGKIELDVYILGRTKEGKLVGLTTKVVET